MTFQGMTADPEMPGAALYVVFIWLGAITGCVIWLWPRNGEELKSYPNVESGEWIQPVRTGYKMRCCDCGLVHRLDFRILRGRVQIRAQRDNRATAACRRKNDPTQD